MSNDAKHATVRAICAINTSNIFAQFERAEVRTASFTWEWLVEYCVLNAKWWIKSEYPTLPDDAVSFARQCTREIARGLIPSHVDPSPDIALTSEAEIISVIGDAEAAKWNTLGMMLTPVEIWRLAEKHYINKQIRK